MIFLSDGTKLFFKTVLTYYWRVFSMQWQSNIVVITVHGHDEGQIAPYPDIEFQLTKCQTYIMIKSWYISLQLIFEETITQLTKLKRVNPMPSKQYSTTG